MSKGNVPIQKGGDDRTLLHASDNSSIKSLTRERQRVFLVYKLNPFKLEQTSFEFFFVEQQNKLISIS